MHPIPPSLGQESLHPGGFSTILLFGLFGRCSIEDPQLRGTMEKKKVLIFGKAG
jgi:hypothetical protein